MSGSDAPSGAGFLVIGLAGKPHGLRGELCVSSRAGSPSLFLSLSRVYLRHPKAPAGAAPRAYAVLAAREQKNTVVLALEGVASRDQAEALRGFEVLARRSELPGFDPDDVYLADIMGFAVHGADDGLEIGRLAGLIESPGQEVWVIAAPGGQEILFPAVPAFVREIDMAARRILVDPPPGLLELYLGEPGPAKEPRSG